MPIPKAHPRGTNLHLGLALAAVAVASFVSCTLVSCTLVSGVNDYKFATGATGAGGATASTGASMSTGATGSMSTGAGCGATAKSCGGSCVALTEPQFGCDSATCDACAAGSTCCPSCSDTTKDPLHCGSCSKQCDADQWCSGACECRPGLTLIQGKCVDTKSNVDHCGGSVCSGTTTQCQASTCVTDCSPPFHECGNNSCVDFQTDPLHCGSCLKACATNEVCFAGECQPFAPAPCASCPCTACPTGKTLCCNYPSTTVPVCVSDAAGSCP